MTKKSKKPTKRPSEPNMITNLDQLKNIILWCKDQKIKKLKLKDLEFEISELDFIPADSNETPLFENAKTPNKETLADTTKETAIEDDPDLFWSSNS